MFIFQFFTPVKRLARKFVSAMTYNASSWMIEPYQRSYVTLTAVSWYILARRRSAFTASYL